MTTTVAARPTTGRRAVARVAAALVAACALLVQVAGPASAHAEIVTSSPADGSTVDTAPDRLSLELSEAVVPGTTLITLTDGSGRTVKLQDVREQETATGGAVRLYRPGDPGAPTTLTVALPASLAPDVYRVRWTTLSAADMHNTSGVVVFGVQRGVTGASGSVEDPLPPWAQVLLRWVGLLGIGAAAAVLAVGRPRELSTTIGRRIDRAAVLAAATAAAAGPLLLVVSARASGAGVGQVLAASGYAWRWGLQEASAALLLAAAAVHLRGRLPRPGVVGVALLAAYAAGTAEVGHGGGSALSTPLRLVADVVHLTAAVLWAGLLVVAVMVLAEPRARAAWRPLLLRIGRPAGWSVTAVTVTGLVLTAAQVASLDALLVSTYGRLLLGKLAVAALGGIAALVTIAVLRPALVLVPAASRPWLRSVTARVAKAAGLPVLVASEAGALVVVLLLAAGVASSRPATGTEWIPASQGVPLRSGQSRDLVETIKLSPNRPGRNFVTVDLFTQKLPAPGPITDVAVVLHGPDGRTVTVPLSQDTQLASSQILGENTPPWVGVTDGIDRPGHWTTQIVVHRDGVGTDTSRYAWLVEDPRARLARPVVSSASWRGPLDAAAVVLAALVALGWWLRRRAGSPAGPGAPDAAGGPDGGDAADGGDTADGTDGGAGADGTAAQDAGERGEEDQAAPRWGSGDGSIAVR